MNHGLGANLYRTKGFIGGIPRDLIVGIYLLLWRVEVIIYVVMKPWQNVDILGLLFTAVIVCDD